MAMRFNDVAGGDMAQQLDTVVEGDMAQQFVISRRRPLGPKLDAGHAANPEVRRRSTGRLRS